MKFPRNIAQTATALATMIALIGITGCSTAAEPEPTPTPTALVFKTDEEAYAAAEEMYRTYAEIAFNVDYSDPAAVNSGDPFLAPKLAGQNRKTLSQYYADSYTRKGAATIVWFRGLEVAENGHIFAVVCEDFTGVEILDSTGASLVREGRPDFMARTIEFINTGEELLIYGAQLRTTPECTG